jgi:hypothetical protein
MIKSILYHLVLVIMFVFISTNGNAQSTANYTSDNKVMVKFYGNNQVYTFLSDELLVRYNSVTQKLECILNVATLVPLNDSIPVNMAYDVFFGAKYPDLLLYIDAPVEKLNGSNLYPGSINKLTTISLQGVSKQTTAPLTLTSNRNSLVFNTSFDLMLDNFSASVPIQYYNLLTGRVMIAINNAKWAGMNIR